MGAHQQTTAPPVGGGLFRDTRDVQALSTPVAPFTSLLEALASAERPTGPARARCGSKRCLALACLGAFFVIFASKLLLIHFASSQIPFSDEWDADAASVIKPFLEGRFGLENLFDHDNEHLIFFTRLLTILDLKLSGYWDVVLPMIVNAFLHSATLALLLAALTRVLDDPKATAAILLGSALAVLPFGNENTLLGFNTHFYTLIAFSFAALWLFCNADAWSPKWFLGVLLAACAFLSMAGGALAPATAAGLAFLQIVRGARRSRPAEWLAVAALLALSAIFIALTPHVPENDVMHAHSVGAFLLGVVDLLAWPLHTKAGALLYLPALAFVWLVLREAPGRDDPCWFNVAVFGWALAQMAALAYGRNGVVLSRYLDICVIGLIANIVSALWLAPRLSALDRRRNFAWLGMAVSLCLAAILLINHGRVAQLGAILERRDNARLQEASLRAYLATGDLAALTARGAGGLPYPSVFRLKALLDDPTIRSTLPPAANPVRHVRPTVEMIKSGLLASWPGFFSIGLLCLIASVWRLPQRREAD
jgi:hypothetical protein